MVSIINITRAASGRVAQASSPRGVVGSDGWSRGVERTSQHELAIWQPAWPTVRESCQHEGEKNNKFAGAEPRAWVSGPSITTCGEAMRRSERQRETRHPGDRGENPTFSVDVPFKLMISRMLGSNVGDGVRVGVQERLEIKKWRPWGQKTTCGTGGGTGTGGESVEN